MNDIVLGVKLVGDSKGFVGEVRLSRQEIQGLVKDVNASKDAASAGRQATEDYAQSLKKAYDTLGQARGAQQQYTDEVKRGSDGSGKAKDAHESLTASVFKGQLGVEALKQAWQVVVQVYQEVVAATIENQQAQLRLEAAIRATGGAAGQTVATVNALADGLARTTRFDDTELKNAAVTLLRFNAVGGDAFGRILKLSADLASTGVGDLQTWITVLGKAGTDPAETIGLLERSFGKLDPQLKVAIANAQYFNDKALEQKLILDEIQKRVGGTAQEAYSGLAQKIEGTEKAWTKLKEAIGNKIFDAQSKDASIFETTLKGAADAVDHFSLSWKTLLTIMKGFAQGGPGGAMFALAMSGQFAGFEGAPSGPNYAAGRIIRLPQQPSQAPSSPTNLLDITQQHELETQGLQQHQAYLDELFKKKQDEIQRELDVEEFRHKAGLDSEQQYYTRIAQLGEAANEADVQRLQGQIADEAAIRKKASDDLQSAVGSGKSDAILAAAKALSAEDAKLLNLTNDLAIAFAKRGDATRKATDDQRVLENQREASVRAIDTDGANYLRSLQLQTEDLQAQYDLMGKSDEQIAEANAQRKIANDYETKHLEILTKINELRKESGVDHSKEIAHLKDEDAAIKAASQSTASQQQLIIRNTFALRDQLSVWGAISDAGSRAFSDLLLHGTSALHELLDEGKQFIAEMVGLFAKRLILQVGASMVGGVGGQALAAQAAAAGQGTTAGAGLNVVSSGMSSLGSSLGIMGSTGLLAGLGGAIGGSFGAGLTFTGSAGLAAGLGELGGAGSLAFQLGAIIPVIGWVIAIAALLYSIFGSKGGGPKQQGAFAGLFSGSGDLLSTLNGQDITDIHGDNQQAAQAQQIAQAAARGVVQTIRSLGGTPSSFEPGIGFAMDPAGTAPSFFHATLADAQGNEYFRYFNDNMSRDSKEFQQQVQAALSRVAVAAIQHDTTIPDAIRRWANTIDASTASDDDIQRILKGAAALKTLIDETKNLSDVIAELTDPTGITAMKDQITGLDKSVTDAQKALADAAKSGDPEQYLSAEQALRQAVMNRYNTEIQLAMQLKASVDALQQQAYEFSLSIAQKINAAGGNIDIAGMAFSRAQDLRGTVGGDFDPAGQFQRVQQFVGAIDTWYSTSRAAIIADLQSQVDASQQAAQAAREAINQQVQAAQQQLAIAQQWVSILDQAKQLLDQMQLTGANPLPVSGRYGIAHDSAAALFAQFQSASGADKAALAAQLLPMLQQELGLLGETYQRPSAAYQAGYNEIIAMITAVQGTATTESDKQTELQQKIVDLQTQANSIQALSLDELEKTDPRLQQLDRDYISQLTWAQTEGARLQNLQITTQQAILDTLTGGESIETFVAQKQAEAVDLLREIRDGVNGFLSAIGTTPAPGTGGASTAGGGDTGNPLARGGSSSSVPKSGGSPQEIHVRLVVSGKDLGSVVVPIVDQRVTGPLMTTIKRGLPHA